MIKRALWLDKKCPLLAHAPIPPVGGSPVFESVAKILESVAHSLLWGSLLYPQRKRELLTHLATSYPRTRGDPCGIILKFNHNENPALSKHPGNTGRHDKNTGTVAECLKAPITRGTNDDPPL
ncbi:hypothetical protein AVEN_242592-1 [Araneus ventricosus]|uniref:Uncharacterized protein n=1 Tax=Araneus ventricosus TaxID=182803 RepID=A0A4Y2EPF1_ARAVE|nr:hypothetical protein AVEN_242592-1 [Araneus ventricosus]